MLSFVIPTLIALWGSAPAKPASSTMTLLASAAGSWIAGILSDRIGRVLTLQLTVLWFAFFTFLCGLAQNYEQLLVARTLMGFGFGGEWTAGAVLIGEVIKARDRGKAVGLVQSGWAIGWGLTAILYSLMFSLLPPEEAWRALFMLGLLPALFVLVVRRLVRNRRSTARPGNATRAPTRSASTRSSPRDAQHHPARLAADHRRARRLLRHHRLAADLPQDRTRADRARHQRLPGDGDPRLPTSATWSVPSSPT